MQQHGDLICLGLIGCLVIPIGVYIYYTKYYNKVDTKIDINDVN